MRAAFLILTFLACTFATVVMAGPAASFTVAQTSEPQQTPATTGTNAAPSILEAAESGDLPLLRAAILREQATADDVNRAQADGMTALHWASVHGNETMASWILDCGAEVNVLNEYKVSPLSLAAERGHAGVVNLLLTAGADVTAARLGGELPLMLAARCGDSETVKLLLAAGADVNAREPKGQTALMWASAAGNTAAIELLIEAGADIDMRLKKSGFNAFLFAAREGQTGAVEKLLEAGADLNGTIETSRKGGRNPRNKMSALMLAIESGHLELALRLVELGADVNDQRSGFTPLHAISWVRKTKRGDDPSGDPPPRISGLMTTLEFVRRIVAAGADVNLQLEKGKSPGKAKLNPKGATPFLFASRTADVPLMELLLELGADPNLNNVDECTPLMAAAGIGVIAVGEEPGTEAEVCAAVRLLAEHGNDVNAVDANRETAMHGAAYRCFPEVVCLLDELGADPEIWNAKNKHGWTPRDIATGKRPGSVKPSPETIEAIDAAKANE